MLQVTDLQCARGGVPVLSDVSFQLDAGQALVLRGPNGIGKTTLLRTLAGLQPSLRGTIDFPEGEGAYASHADGIKTAGQKRRLGLARLGVVGRKVLFLDEPTVSLDGFSVKLFAGWLRDVHLASGGLAVIATHIDLGLDAPELELSPFAAKPEARGGSDEAFL